MEGVAPPAATGPPPAAAPGVLPGTGPGAELPPPRVRTARQRWTTRGILGALGLMGLGLFHQFNYSRKVTVYRDSSLVIREELVPEVTAITGPLERYPWWDVRGATWSWEWRPRTWFRELGAWVMGRDQPLYHESELVGVSKYRMRGEMRDAVVEARAHQRAANEWQLVWLKMSVPQEGGMAPKEFVIIDRRLKLPDNMTRRLS